MECMCAMAARILISLNVYPVREETGGVSETTSRKQVLEPSVDG